MEACSEELVEMGMADHEEVNVSKSRNNIGASPAKADLAGFDREKFYKRLGVDPD